RGQVPGRLISPPAGPRPHRWAASVVRRPFDFSAYEDDPETNRLHRKSGLHGPARPAATAGAFPRALSAGSDSVHRAASARWHRYRPARLRPASPVPTIHRPAPELTE